MASRSLSDLHPQAREKAMQWETACRREGVEVLIYCTYRSGAEQDMLYAIGRTAKGKIVTNAKAGDSFHQHRVAWDAVPLVGGKPAWGAKDLYAKMGEVAKTLGIEWAGEWVRFKETAHFQYTGGLTLADLKAGKTLVA